MLSETTDSKNTAFTVLGLLALHYGNCFLVFNFCLHAVGYQLISINYQSMVYDVTTQRVELIIYHLSAVSGLQGVDAWVNSSKSNRRLETGD